MKKQSKYERTQAHTQLACAWLWHVKGCRILGLEVGINAIGNGLTAAAGAWWRADIVGMKARNPTFVSGQRRLETQAEIHVVEVKGHRQDLLREVKGAARHKFSARGLRAPQNLYHWLVVSHEITDADLEPVGSHWGVLRATGPEAEGLELVREPRDAHGKRLKPGPVADDRYVQALYYLARAPGPRLPAMGPSSPHEKAIRDTVRRWRA